MGFAPNVSVASVVSAAAAAAATAPTSETAQKAAAFGSATLVASAQSLVTLLHMPATTTAGIDRNAIEFRSRSFDLDKFARHDYKSMSTQLRHIRRDLVDLRQGKSRDVVPKSILDPSIDELLAKLPPVDPIDASASFEKITLPRHLPGAPTLTPLERERTMDRLGGAKEHRTYPCALCRVAFAKVNLPTPVIRRSVFDLLDKWGAKPEGKERFVALQRQPPMCYETVHVCRFCTQFFPDIAAEVTATTLTPNVE